MRRLAWALLAVVALCGACSRGPSVRAVRPWNVVLVSLDTVRRDHLGTYGYRRETSPRLDALANRSTVFWNAIAQETNTAPSHASMFSGLYPEQHGSTANVVRIGDEVPTLASILRDAGYDTGGFVAGFPLFAKLSGLDRGFDTYDDEFRAKRRSGEETTARALKWLVDRSADRPWFLFLHLYDAHGPYEPTAEQRAPFRSGDPGPTVERIPPYQLQRRPDGTPIETRNDYVDRYDAMIRVCDGFLGKLLDSVDLSRTIVVVLADHGETLDERHRPFDHGAHVTEEQIRIPLVIHVPGVAPSRAEPMVETVDLLPTILELIRLPLPDGVAIAGRSLVPLLNGDATVERPLTFASATAMIARYEDVGYELDETRRIYGIRSARWKLVVLPGVAHDYLELYDLLADPGEKRSVLDGHPGIREEFLAALEKHLARARSTPTSRPELDPEEIERLRSLGYVGN